MRRLNSQLALTGHSSQPVCRSYQHTRTLWPIEDRRVPLVRNSCFLSHRFTRSFQHVSRTAPGRRSYSVVLSPRHLSYDFSAHSNPLQYCSCRRHYSFDASNHSQPFSLQLSHRALVAVVGHDAPSFLQGLTTNNIPFKLPEADGQLPTALSTAFLNAQGRILQDVLVYTLPTSSSLIENLALEPRGGVPSLDVPSFLIEVDRTQVAGLVKALRRYKLRSKVAIREVSPEQLGIAFCSGGGAAASSTLPSRLFCAKDERAPGLGFRLIGSPDEVSQVDLAAPATLDVYRLHRYRHGVPEGQDELPAEQALVQESDLDLMSGVDFRKGCYIGQELVIRTQHTGVVRKRILPVTLYGAGTNLPDASTDVDPSAFPSIPYGADIKRVGDTDTAGRRNRSAGKWVANVGNTGLALVRLEAMAGLGPTGDPIEGWQAPEFMVDAGRGDEANPRVTAVVPEWWTQRKHY